MDPAWLFEFKHDGLRALAVIEHGACRFISVHRQKVHGLRDLGAEVMKQVHAGQAIVDGEVVVTDHLGRTMFADMMKRRKLARFCAFDLVWVDGEDSRSLPLIKRKQALKRILPSRSAYVLYVDHVLGAGQRLYELACELDLEGIVTKRADSPYGESGDYRDWILIKNPGYSRRQGRGELFKRAG